MGKINILFLFLSSSHPEHTPILFTC